jgi:hypothetical protein
MTGYMVSAARTEIEYIHTKHLFLKLSFAPGTIFCI